MTRQTDEPDARLLAAKKLARPHRAARRATLRPRFSLLCSSSTATLASERFRRFAARLRLGRAIVKAQGRLRR